MATDVRKIGIIGAGVAGLITAKSFLEEGFDCEVLERKGSLGGVWENGYHSLRLQLPRESYEFLDWPMPASFPKFPSCDQIVSYLKPGFGAGPQDQVNHYAGSLAANQPLVPRQPAGGFNAPVGCAVLVAHGLLVAAALHTDSKPGPCGGTICGWGRAVKP
ncbi:MAG: NAD(P)-binding protein [Gammaproteobacteria bacterium]|nr:NAD(P)-binding protein [Gammaproteobacteria bacterium]NNF60514.1 NAD(P)-binding protein [Gammaproteobacteria bacterium]